MIESHHVAVIGAGPIGLELAVALKRRGHSDDSGRVTRLLEESAATGRTLGMVWLLDQIERA